MTDMIMSHVHHPLALEISFRRGPAILSLSSILAMPVRPFTAIPCIFPKSSYEVVHFEKHLDACREYSRHTCCLYH